jgi:hypothetical protein
VRKSTILYVGLDVGLEETSLCSVDGEGLTVREVEVMTEPAAIRSAVENYADRLERVRVEASSLGIWLYRELQEAGLPINVVEATPHARFTVDNAEQDRQERRAGHCADDATGLVPRRLCQEYRHAEDAHVLDQLETAGLDWRQRHSGSRLKGRSSIPSPAVKLRRRLAVVAVDGSQQGTKLAWLGNGGTVVDLRSHKCPAEVDRDVARPATGCDLTTEDHAGHGPQPAGAFVTAALLELPQSVQQLRRSDLCRWTVSNTT